MQFCCMLFCAYPESQHVSLHMDTMCCFVHLCFARLVLMHAAKPAFKCQCPQVLSHEPSEVTATASTHLFAEVHYLPEYWLAAAGLLPHLQLH